MSIEQAVHFAGAGQHVAWIGVNLSHAQGDVLAKADELVAGKHPGLRKVYRANGSTRIEFENGGKLIPMSVARLERVTLDFAYLPDWELIRDEVFMAGLLPLFRSTGLHPRIGVII